MAVPTISAEDCVGCESCISACPSEVLAMKDDVAYVAAPDDCVECAACADECPSDAITV